jgi:hypothetical protein
MGELFYQDDLHQYRHGSPDGPILPSVTRIIDAPHDFFTPDDALRGTRRHKAVELWIQGTLDQETLADEYKPYLEAWIRFEEETGFIVKETEKLVHHDLHLYAGRIDLIGTFPGDAVDTLIDIKTGVYAPYAALQTAAYAGCLPGFHKRFVLQLKADGKYKMWLHSDRQNWVEFVTLLNCKRVRAKYNLDPTESK